MTESQNLNRTEEEIFPHSLDEYQEKVGEIIRNQNEKFSQLAQEQAKEIIEGAWRRADEIIHDSQDRGDEIIADSEKRAETIVVESQRKALRVSSEIEHQANQKALEITEEGKRRAQQIIREAEEKVKKEARDSMKSQKEKILAEAKDEASSIISEAKEDAERRSNDIVEKVKREAQKSLEEEMSRFRTDAQTQIAQIRLEAEKKAAELIDDVTSESKAVNEMIIENINKSEAMLGKFRSEMQVEIEDLIKNTTRARQRLERKITSYSQVNEAETAGREINGQSNTDTALWVTLRGEQSDQRGDGSYLFKGQIEMKTLAQMDYLKIRKLKSFMIQVPNMKYLGEVSGEEGIVLSFDIKEPLPLLDIFSNVPSVRDVVAQGENIKLILN
jgi:vacuolar-type H+-ATPase subunit H